MKDAENKANEGTLFSFAESTQRDLIGWDGKLLNLDKLPENP